MKKLLLLFFCFYPLLSFAQYLNWARQISGPGVEYIKGTATDASGNIYVVGYFSGTIDFDPGSGVVNATAVGTDIWFGKYSSTGNYIWAKQLTGGNNDYGTDIAVDASGNLYITGYYTSLSPAIDFDPSGGTTPAPTYAGAFVAKYTNSGVYTWYRVIGNTGADTRGCGIALDATGNAYITGKMSGSNINVIFDAGLTKNTSSGQIFYARFNTATGSVAWAKNTGPGSNSAAGNDIAVNGSNLFITGTFSGAASDFNPDGVSTDRNPIAGAAFVARYSTNTGTFGWSGQVLGQAGDVGKSIAVDNSGTCYLAGSLNNRGTDIFIWRFTFGALPQQPISIGGTSEDRGQSITIDNNGNAYLGGYVTGGSSSIDFNGNFLSLPANKVDLFIAKYDAATLTAKWVRNLDMTVTAGSTENEVNALALSNGQLILSGDFSGSGDFNPCISSASLNSTTTDAYIASYFPDEPLLAGPDWLCNNNAYAFSLSGVPPWATISWSVSPIGLVTPNSGSSGSFVVTPIAGASGNITVSVVVSGTGNCPINVGPISAYVGAPAIVFNPGGNSICTNNPYYSVVPQLPNASYNWQVSNPNVWITSGNGVPTVAVISTTPETFSISVTITTQSCSVTVTLPDQFTPGYYCQCFQDPSCGGGFSRISVSPNPASSSLNILIEDEKQKDGIYSAKLFSSEGYEVRRYENLLRKSTLNVEGLKKGTYFLQINSYTKTDMVRILID